MLILKNIKKDYVSKSTKVNALKGVDIEFGKNEFVSILGPSGCGKTTLLNIIGGLDRYTEGDLLIRGKSTKSFKDYDWDVYRNNTIGFVFQTYNLISHQTVLTNVELALTLSGVSKHERKRKAITALEKVGLGDQLKKKPNQLSGGQMQRVAIARALVNDPDIILADEPTGALDTKTSMQVLDILKEISKDKLVIMVTHNDKLAEKYSTRIVKLLDGNIIGDELREGELPAKKVTSTAGVKIRKTSMSFFTALSLSLKNLMTKKGRTVLTSFAGSIGIIGIALILALSNGIQLYINRVQEDTLSSYPLEITKEAVDMVSLLQSMSDAGKSKEKHDLDAVYSNTVASKMINSMLAEVKENNLEAFKKFIESSDSGMSEYVSTVQYGYGIDLNIYTMYTDKNGVQSLLKVNPSDILAKLRGQMAGSLNPMYQSGSSESAGISVWTEMLDDKELLDKQFDVVAGHWPNSYDEVVLIVDENNELSDMAMYALGMKDVSELEDIMEANQSGETLDTEQTVIQYDDILNTEFKLVLNSDFFVKEHVVEVNGAEYQVWSDMSGDEDYIKALVYGENTENTITLKIVGIIKPDENAISTSASGAIGYSSELTSKLINDIMNSEIAKQQIADPARNVLTGLEFISGEITMAEIQAYIDTLPEQQRQAFEAYISMLSETQVIALFKNVLSSDITYESVCQKIGIVDTDKPSVIRIYADSFAAKDKILEIIDNYNKEHADDGNAIEYTDYVGLLMSSVSIIINFISYALIAFVSISLVVSSIMIGIITYISVLERTKEIGILRSIGASKKDISRVFNAETLIVGFAAGIMGILLTLVLIIPLNMIIGSLSDIYNIASLPVAGAVVLVLISMTLTFIAGLIPSRMASKKDPVVALRTE
ncbi:MAG: ABC transporter ATP-binding protein/permease [Eubacteriales bacterium]|nr:ABC transporter ATP-binding protein/permease [Eubacteriales bacterium]